MIPKISVIIPVKNGSRTIVDCLNGIFGQTLIGQTEIILIDSGSIDDTMELASKYKIKLLEIDPKTFNHGTTRNLGVQYAQGDFVVMTVQDAVAVNDTWLETMLGHFKDPEVAGVCGQQIVPRHPDKNPHEWFRPQSPPKERFVQYKNWEAFEKLTPAQQKNICGWDDVNAMYRKTVLEKIPFLPLAFGEDMFWAKQALEAGYKLVYDPISQIAHYHFQYPEYTYRRTLITNIFTYKCFGYIRPTSFTLKDYLLVVYRNLKWGCAPKWILHNFSIMYQRRKATKKLLEAIDNNTIGELEKELSLNVPIGKQNNK